MIYNCTDKSVIKNIVLHPKVMLWLSDDNSADYEVIIHPQIYYLVNEENSGVIRVDKMNSITCSVHIATLPSLWGNGHAFVQEALEWGFANTLYQKVVGIIPAYNEKVIRLVKDFNFKQEGVLTKSFLKNWVLADQLIFGLSKGDF